MLPSARRYSDKIVSLHYANDNETGARRIVAIARGLLKLVLPFSNGMCQRTLRFLKIFNAVSCFPLGVIVPIEIVRAAGWMCSWKTREGGEGCYFFLRARLGTEWVNKCVCTKWICDREGRSEVVWLVFLSFYDSWWFLYAGFVRRCRLYWKDEIEQDVRRDGQWGKFFIAGVNCEFIFRGICFLVWRERPAS